MRAFRVLIDIRINFNQRRHRHCFRESLLRRVPVRRED